MLCANHDAMTETQHRGAILEARHPNARAMKNLLLAFAFAACAASAAPPNWTITTLPTLPSERAYGIAQAINNRGEIVGWSYVYHPEIDSSYGYAVKWDNGVLTNLGEGSATAINDRGTITGTPGGLSIWEDGASQWTHLTSSAGWAYGINKFGAIAGWFVSGQPHGFVYRDATLLDVGTLGGHYSVATGINDRGQVAGMATIPGDAHYHAFLWDNGVMKDLGTLGGFESRAHDINNHGVVVGEAWTASGDSRPFIYDGVMRLLFDSPECCIVPHAMNDHGAVVGTIAGNASFLYEDGVLTRLESLPAVRAAGWTQLVPNDINDRGWIVGFGLKDPSLTPPRTGWLPFVLKR